MKIAVTSQENNLDANVDPRFGRAKYFLIADTESDETEFVDNEQNLASASGAGVQSAQHVVNSGVQAVLTGHCGPKAFRALQAAGIVIYTGVEGAVKQAIDDFKSGKLTQAQSADVKGHWS